MTASTVLEIVRMLFSGLGVAGAVVFFLISWGAMRRRRTQDDAASRIESFRIESENMDTVAQMVHACAYLVIQLGMLYVAHEAYLQPDSSPNNVISSLTLDSNLNQIVAICIVMFLTAWNLRDFWGHQKIVRLAEFEPPKRAARSRTRPPAAPRKSEDDLWADGLAGLNADEDDDA